MAPKITSSSDRSKRQARSKATVRSDKGRKNRQSASTAKTTNSKDRKSTGSARVTTSKSEQKALPPKGGTSANSPKAQYQRGMTRDAQAKQALTTVARGTSRMVRRMNAQDKQEAAAKGTKGTRQRVATGTPDRPQLPPAVNRPPAKGSSSATSSSKVEQVKVKDVTPAKRNVRGSSSSRVLTSSRPAGNGMPFQAADGRNIPLDKNGWPKGTERWADQGGKSNAPRTSNTPRLPGAKGPLAGGLRGGLAGAAIYAAGDAVLGPVARKAGEALGKFAGSQQDKPYMRQGEKQQPNPNSSRRRVKGGDAESKFPMARRNAEIRTNRIKAATPDTKSANDGQRTRQAEQRRSSGSVTAAPQPRQSSVRPSQSAPRTATAGAGAKGSKWEDFNPGRGTSETTNPLIKKDSWLMGKIKQREDTQSKNVGPVSDGGEYSASKKSAEIVARRKKKEEEDKKKAQQ